MNTAATTAPDALAVHRAVMAAAGVEALDGLIRPITDREAALLDAWAARTDSTTDEDLRVLCGLPPDADVTLIRDAVREEQS